MTETASPPVDGVLLLDKPIGISSNTAIQYAKRLLHAVKVGHVGTLDPLASGLLPICMGEATKFSSSTFGADKSYDAEILLGVTTTTGDTEGEVTARQGVAVNERQIAEALQRFSGSIKQTPPMYSALKRNGKPLYSYARAGHTVARIPRRITIHSITLNEFTADRLHISVHCSKGTYIRVLAEDIGSVLGCGATLAGLRRVSVGAFDLAQAVTFKVLESLSVERRQECVLPADTLVSALPELHLDARQERMMVTGQSSQSDLHITGLVRLYSEGRRFIGLGEMMPGGLLVPKRLVATSAAGATVEMEKQLQASKIT